MHVHTCVLCECTCVHPGICMCMFLCVHAYVCMHICMCVHMYIYNVCMFVSTQTYVLVCACTCVSCMHVCSFMCVRVCVRTCVRMHTCMYLSPVPSLRAVGCWSLAGVLWSALHLCELLSRPPAAWSVPTCPCRGRAVLMPFPQMTVQCPLPLMLRSCSWNLSPVQSLKKSTPALPLSSRNSPRSVVGNLVSLITISFQVKIDKSVKKHSNKNPSSYFSVNCKKSIYLSQ